jgi:tetratricopeptide (TPR) repeat protein
MPRIFAFLVLGLLSLHAQRTSDTSNQPKQLTVKVAYDSGPAVGMGNRVQLLNGTGTPVTENFTDDRGEVLFIVDAGSYRIRVTGNEIEETASERSFYIDRRELFHTEYLSVKKKVDPNVPSLEGHVSAAMLRIPSKAKSEVEKGMKELAKNDFEKAKPHFQKATDLYPQYAEAFNALGVIAMNAGQQEEGRVLFDKAIAADPEFAGSYVNKAKILMAAKQISQGEESLRKATTLDPLNAEALSLLAICQFQSGQRQAAIDTAQRTHQLPHEKRAVVHYIAGKAYEQQNQFADALREYRLFLKESPAASPTVSKVKEAVAALEAKSPESH